MKIQNPHDKIFKETFGDVEVAESFLESYLPNNLLKMIDVTTLEPQKDSFINEELKEDFSDLLYKVNIEGKEGFIYFLFEHKSYSSKDISFQLLRYIVSIWNTKVEKEQFTELPVVIPLVIYHGKENWNSTLTLGELIQGYKQLPKDIQRHSDMLLLSIERAISYLHEIEDQQTGIEYFQTMMLYIFGAKKNFSKKVGKKALRRNNWKPFKTPSMKA